jgi:hypothetical protein
MSADELLPVLAFILVQACIPNLLSEVHEHTLALLQKNAPQPRDRFALTRCTALCVCVGGVCVWGVGVTSSSIFWRSS